MYLNEGEIIVCGQCGKEIVVSQNLEKDWFCVSNVNVGQESNWTYFCSYECLKASINEPETLFLQRLTLQRKDFEWRLEELFLKHNILARVEKHENSTLCPLCKKKLEDGDLIVFFRGKVIHSSCIEKFKNEEQV